MAKQIILLNADYSFLGFINKQRAIKLIIKDKVEVIQKTNEYISSISRKYILPKIVKLVRLITSIYRNKLPFSKRNVLIRDRFICQYCMSKIDPTVDHILPVSRGGKSNFKNCVTACKICNNKKDRKTPLEAGMTLLHDPYTPTIMEFILIRAKTLGLDKILLDILKDVKEI